MLKRFGIGQRFHEGRDSRERANKMANKMGVDKPWNLTLTCEGFRG
jgi:hypothetical protein